MLPGLLRRWWVRGVLFTLWAMGVSVVVPEVALRLTSDWQPGYYQHSSELEPGVLTYAWGEVPVNSVGWPDDEPGPKRRSRVGWVGDSVVYGVGAGYGSRITEVMDELRPDLEHVNLGAVGYPGLEAGDPRLAPLVGQLGLDQLVYVMNLNDVRPDHDPNHPLHQPPTLPLSFLRDWSYLYAAVDDAFHTWSVVAAPEWRPPELAPVAEAAVFRATIRRTREAVASFEALGARVGVVLLPYEMQVSAAAAAAYREAGLVWDEGFEFGSAQRILVEGLAGIAVVDALEAFVPRDGAAAARASNPRCRYFVCDRGGRLDWNHLTSEGHRTVATFVHESGLLDE